MKKEQLKKGNELKRLIDDLCTRIKAISAIEDGTHTPGAVKLELQAKPGSSNGDFHNDHFSSGNDIPLELKEKVTEELIDCASRIRRIFEKEIKKLEKEFESL
ncbi:MAG: hypothetical protein KGZ82_04435 [Bacteroidales bacterium]|nr:hypothetical protein [Bacteroidales bacterium]